MGDTETRHTAGTSSEQRKDRKTSEFEVIIDNVTLNLAPAHKISEAKHFLGKYPHFIHTALSKALH